LLRSTLGENSLLDKYQINDTRTTNLVANLDKFNNNFIEIMWIMPEILFFEKINFHVFG